MGAAGTDAATETADVVLMGDNLGRLPYAIGLSRQVRRVIAQNLVFAFCVVAVLVTVVLVTGYGWRSASWATRASRWWWWWWWWC